MSFIVPETKLDRQTPSGEHVADMPPLRAPAPDEQLAVVTAQQIIPLEFDNKAPEVPISDPVVETFLMKLIELNPPTAATKYEVYKSAGFTLTGRRYEDMNAMRLLMRNPRVRDRFKWLQQSEWELEALNKVHFKKMIAAVMDDSFRPQDKLTAISMLGDLCEVKDSKSSGGGNKTVVIFNASEQPTQAQAITIEAHSV